MAKTSLIIETTDTSGKKLQKTFTDVNPEASSADLKTFAQMCVGLTNDTYVRTDRVNKINCDTEDSGDGRAEATLTFPEVVDGAIIVRVETNTFYNIFYNGSKLTKAVLETLDNYEIAFDSTSTNIRLGLKVVGDYVVFDTFTTAGFSGPCPVTLTLGGNETYKPVSVTATFFTA